MKAKGIVFGIVLWLTHCYNYGLLDKMKDPGSLNSIARKVFVTSATTPGSMSVFITIPGCTGLGTGTPGADCVCRVLAANAGLTRSGSFIAWLSDSSNDARCRLQGSGGNTCTGTLSGSWYNVKGDLVARDFSSLTSASLSAPILYTEAGGFPTSPSNIHTGTDTTGRKTTGNCSDWTSSSSGGSEHYGNSAAKDSFWTQGTTGTGCTNGHVYCFEGP